MTDKKDQLEECSKIFVGWKALIIGVLGLVGVAISASFAYAIHESGQDNTLSQINTRLDRVDKVMADIDTIKNILRKK